MYQKIFELFGIPRVVVRVAVLVTSMLLDLTCVPLLSVIEEPVR